MSVDGMWSFVYSGVRGTGIGFFRVENGQVRGIDGGGAVYRGTVTEAEDGTLSVDFDMDAPAGVWLVSGASEMEVPHTRHRTLTMPKEFGDGEPVPLETPPGQTIVMIKRVAEEYTEFTASLLGGFRFVPR